MTVVRKILLLIELVIGFGLILYFWLLGLILSPVLVVNIFSGDVGSLFSFSAFVLGAFGLWGMLQLVMKILSHDTAVTAPARLKILLGCGYVAIFIAVFAFGAVASIESLAFLLPVLVATHFVYLCRGYLWQNS